MEPWQYTKEHKNSKTKKKTLVFRIHVKREFLSNDAELNEDWKVIRLYSIYSYYKTEAIFPSAAKYIPVAYLFHT